MALAGCGAPDGPGGPGPGTNDSGAVGDLGAADLGPSPDLFVPKVSNIKHLVVIVQENHTFDAYFGRYCTAPAGSNPTCTAGPACCEQAPVTEPSGHAPMLLDDTENSAYDRNHTQACELTEMNGGKMDRYVAGADCSNPRNFAIAPDAVVKPYHDFATQYALADRYFQPLVGQSSSNDMYFAVAKYVFKDNDLYPAASGHGCWGKFSTTTLTGTTIADLLINAGQKFAYYAEGYRAMKQAALCPDRPADCTYSVALVVPKSSRRRPA